MCKCHFCEKEIVSKYRVMEKNGESFFQCRSCERKSRLHDKNNETGIGYTGYRFLKYGDIRKSVNNEVVEFFREQLKDSNVETLINEIGVNASVFSEWQNGHKDFNRNTLKIVKYVYEKNPEQLPEFLRKFTEK